MLGVGRTRSPFSSYHSPMTSPFRYNKKERRHWRKRAKSMASSADKSADKGMDPKIVADMRSIAEMNRRISLAKRRKSMPKNPK
jgi:hypothetical protein